MADINWDGVTATCSNWGNTSTSQTANPKCVCRMCLRRRADKAKAAANPKKKK